MLIQPVQPSYASGGRAEVAPRDPTRETTLRTQLPSDPPPDDAGPVAVRAAVEASNRVVQSLQSKIEFVTDDSSGEMLIKVIDPSNNELIRQIPSEEMLAISRALDRMQGLLVKSEA